MTKDEKVIQAYKKNFNSLSKEVKELQKNSTLSANEHMMLLRTEEIVKEHVQQLAELSQAQFTVLVDKLDNLIEQVHELKEKISKRSTNHMTLPLRDPILRDIVDALLQAELPPMSNQSVLPYAQFKVAFVLMFLSGCRVNETRTLTEKDIRNIKSTYRLNLVQSKTRTARQAVMGEQALKYLDFIEPELRFIFEAKKLEVLGGTPRHKDKAMHPISWIRAFNRNLKLMKDEYDLNLYLTSHSLRIGYVTRLLTRLDIDKVRQIVGHANIQTTQKYKKFSLPHTSHRSFVTRKALGEITDAAIHAKLDDTYEL